MSRRLFLLRRRLGPALRPLLSLARRLGYRPRRLLGAAAGGLSYVFASAPPDLVPGLEVRLPAAAADPGRARAWCRAQTERALAVVAIDGDGRTVWRVDRDGPAEPPARTWGFFLAPGALPAVYPAWAESALLVAAAEEVEAVVLLERLSGIEESDGSDWSDGSDAEGRGTWRRFAVFRADRWRYDPARDHVSLADAGGTAVVKAIGPEGVDLEAPRDPGSWNDRRRGPYRALGTARLPPVLEIGLRDVATLPRPEPVAAAAPKDDGRPTVLVTLSFLAYGGAEHILFETLYALRERYRFVIVTLAPHHPDRGDRRADFAAITERLICLGDLVHPAAMYGILLALIDRLGTRLVFNSNGTTLFYELAPRLARDRPEVRIIDQLYDHRIGYINWYDDGIREAVDACVAANRRIRRVLVEERGWPPARVPVIWSCGRRDDAFPAGEEAARVRAAIRRELGLADGDLVLLTAARMNAQKRPLDLVRLAARLRDAAEVAFVIVGGGELEDEVDTAIAGALERGGARIRRLPFRDDIPALIVAADVGCLVSDFEGLPVFMIECLQGGRPFLGTDVGEMGDILRDTGAGLVVDRPGDLDALEAAVRRLRDPALRAALATRAAEAAPLFSIATCAARYDELFTGRT